MADNLVIGWTLVLLGFVSGLFLGLHFHEDAWMGGYGSFPRRLIRLGHIALVALGMVNVLFAVSVDGSALSDRWRQSASWLFITGGFAMPLCCILTARFPRARACFVVPVIALICAAAIMAIGSVVS